MPTTVTPYDQTTAGTLYGGPQSATYQVQGQPTFADFLRLGNNNYNSLQGYKNKTLYAIAGSTGANEAAAMGKPAATYGYASLANMLANQGKIDPGVLNTQLRANDLGTQASQGQTSANFARNGLQGSGLMQAILAAQGQGGQNRGANIRYQDSADAYARQQQNLNLLQQLVLNPQRDYAAINAGQYSTDKAAQTQQTGATTSAVAAIVGALLCRVAAALYGDDSQKFKDARSYMFSGAPAGLSTAYLIHGAELASAVKSDPTVRERMLPVFDEFARRGAQLAAA